MTCIKNGAYVHLIDYGVYAPADIYTVADAVVVRFNGNPEDVGAREQLRPRTHTLYLNENGDDVFWRKDLGLAVVPESALVEVAS